MQLFRSKTRFWQVVRCALGVLLLAASGLHSWSDEELAAHGRAVPADVPEPVRRLFGDSLREFTRLSPRHFPALFPGQTLYRVARFNPASVIAGPDTFVSCVIEKEGSFRHLHQDADAIRALVETATPVPDVVAAIARVSVFAELRCYPLQVHGLTAPADASNPLGWSLIAAGRDDG